jgi:hypothetical protein
MNKLWLLLGGLYGGQITALSVERERIAREIARIEDEIAKLRRLQLAA